MGRTRVRTEHVDTSRDATYEKFKSEQRCLNEKLQACIFGCTAQTKDECLQGQIFGLPGRHWLYVENIFVGMPLFLFNYSSKELYGIFQAADDAVWDLNPSGWSRGGGKTQYPAQVKVRLSEQCPAIKIAELYSMLPRNFDSKQHLIFELDGDDVRKLMRKLIGATGKSKDYVDRRVNEIMQESQQGWNKWYSQIAQPPPSNTPAVASSSSQVGQSGVLRPNFCQPAASSVEYNRPRGAWAKPLQSVNTSGNLTPSASGSDAPKIIPTAPPSYVPQTAASNELSGQWGANLCTPPPSNSPNKTVQQTSSAQSSRSSQKLMQNSQRQQPLYSDVKSLITQVDDSFLGVTNQPVNYNNNSNYGDSTQDAWGQTSEWQGSAQQQQHWGNDDSWGNGVKDQTINNTETFNADQSKVQDQQKNNYWGNNNNNNKMDNHNQTYYEEPLIRKSRGSSNSNSNSVKNISPPTKPAQTVPDISDVPNAGTPATNFHNSGDIADVLCDDDITNVQNAEICNNVQNSLEINLQDGQTEQSAQDYFQQVTTGLQVENHNVPIPTNQQFYSSNQIVQNQLIDIQDNTSKQIVDTQNQLVDMHAQQSDVQQLLQNLTQYSPGLAQAVQMQFIALGVALNDLHNQLQNSYNNQQSTGDVFGMMQLQFQTEQNKFQVQAQNIIGLKEHFSGLASQMQQNLMQVVEKQGLEVMGAEEVAGENIVAESTSQGYHNIVKQEMYLIGGGFPSFVNRMDVWDGGNWSSRCAPPEEKAYAAAAATGDHLYYVGGATLQINWGKTAYCYNLYQDKWTQICELKENRGSMAMVALNGKVIVLGGANKDDNKMVYLNSTEIYDDERDVWEFAQPMQQPRGSVAAQVLNNAIYAVGGFTGKSYLKSYERFDGREGKWEEFGDVFQFERGTHCVVSYRDYIIALAGYNGQIFCDQVEMLDTRMNRAISLNPLVQRRSHAIAGCIGDGLYCMGGIGMDGTSRKNLQSMEFLNLSKGESTWEPVQVAEEDLGNIRTFAGNCVVNTYQQ